MTAQTVEVKAVYVDTGTRDGKKTFKSPRYTLVTDGNERYSTFDSAVGKILEESKGKLVDIELVQNGNFTNIESVTPHLNGGNPNVTPMRPRDPRESRLIQRQVALKCAVELVAAKTVAPDLLLATADKLVRWIDEQSEVKRMTSAGDEV
jgi:hypothetical protein